MTLLQTDEKGNPIQVGRMGAVQSVDIGATATEVGAVFDSSVVRIVSTFDCHLLLGASPTAATTDTFMPANTPEYFSVKHGVDTLSIIAASGATDVLGTIYTTEA